MKNKYIYVKSEVVHLSGFRVNYNFIFHPIPLLDCKIVFFKYTLYPANRVHSIIQDKGYLSHQLLKN